MSNDAPQSGQPDSHGWQAGDDVGPYHILDQIGEGGFGSVYLAEQREPVRRRVALKVIKPGMDSKEVIARFEAERQALAMMDHPNVAHVFDAGMTPLGRPFFAMEYVPGVPITDYCDEHKLSTIERIELFITACHAVQHAHQKGIIHRDLKPSNMLVTLFDQKPVTKVIDFGIAKATSQQLTDKTLYTEAGRMIGTPEYMSPEQAGTSGLDIDTRADVYSLGVILYQLLSGQLPFAPEQLRSAGFDEVMRAIKEDEPPKLSARVASTDTKTAAQLRRSDSRTLLRELRGDLDWISMKAMEKDRSRRYDTANGLAMDLQRFLNHEPVIARPPSASYRLSRFMRKHRVGVAAGGVVTLALLAGTAGTGWGMIEAQEQRDTAVELGSNLELAKADAERERDAAQEQRDEAQRLRTAEAEARTAAEASADQAEAVTKFMVDLLGLANPDVSGRSDLTVRELLDKAAADVGRAFRHQPRAEARVRAEIGRAYGNVGDLESAKNQLARALEILDNLPGSTPAEIHAVRWPYAQVLRELVDRSSSREQTRAVEVGRDVVRESYPELAAALDGHWTAVQPLIEFGNYNREAAERERQRAMRVARGALSAADAQWALVGDEFAVLGTRILTTSKGNIAANQALAAGYFAEAVAMYRRCLKDTNMRLVRTQMFRFTALREHGKLDEAEAVARQTRGVLEQTLGSEHWYTARFGTVLARSLTDRKQFEEAERLLTASHTVIARVVGGDSRPAIRALVRRMELYEEWGKPDEVSALRMPLADAHARSRVVPDFDTVRNVLGPKHELTVAMTSLAVEIKRNSPAVGRHLDEVLALRQRILPDGDSRAAIVGHILAQWGRDLHARDRRPSASQRMLEAAVRLGRDWSPSRRDFALDHLAWIHRAARRYTEAEPYLREAIAVCSAAFGERHPRTLWHLSMLGTCQRRMGQFEEAEATLKKAYDTLVEIEGPTAHGVSDAFDSLVLLYRGTDRRAEAVRFAATHLQRLLDSTVPAAALNAPIALIVHEPGLGEASYALALEAAKRAVQADPDGDNSRAGLGLAQYRMGQRERAWQTLGEVQRLAAGALRVVLGEDFAELGRAMVGLNRAAREARPTSQQEFDRLTDRVRAAIDDMQAARAALPLDDPRATIVAGTLLLIGQNYSRVRPDRRQVLRIFEDAVALARAADGKQLVAGLWWLAVAHSNLNQAEGIPIIEEYIERVRNQSGDVAYRVANGKRILGAILFKLGRPGAEAAMMAGYRGLVEVGGQLDGNAANVLSKIEKLLLREDRIEELARIHADRLAAILEAGGAGGGAVNIPACWIVLCPDLEPELYELALRGADWGNEAQPDNWYIVNTRANALYRLGRFDEALKTFERSIELCDADSELPPHPADYAMLAMTQWRLEQRDKARGSLARAQELMAKNPKFANENEASRFLAEAEVMIQ